MSAINEPPIGLHMAVLPLKHFFLMRQTTPCYTTPTVSAGVEAQRLRSRWGSLGGFFARNFLGLINYDQMLGLFICSRWDGI